ncbi:MAG TPA: UDP-N-acetylglucosamine 2-epimerase (non-hydrolyzing) [Bryobacteraceae bacterium]|nr:UDP-N-acetylglucosamine 2-epimerase (non-hydrolyzing) [Bryobacteraceae bacterium]
MTRKILVVFGTRPEAIKLCPVVRYMRNEPNFRVSVCATGQHLEMLQQVLDVFQVEPDHRLGLMLPGQTLFQSTSRILAGLEQVLQSDKPDMVLVQGDTTTTLCGALAGFYAGVPVGHVEAGLRTGNVRSPFPEEMNRVLTTRLSALHFAATEQSADNLRREGIADQAIEVTGNTGVDAVLQTAALLESGRIASKLDALDQSRKLIVVTAHRRESFGDGFERICQALARIAERDDVEIVYPVHPNPNVQNVVKRVLSERANIKLLTPLDYVSFVDLMRRSYLLLTDSGGVQEEGPSFGKPVLVMRDNTERPEAVQAGTASLVGTDVERIVGAVEQLLDDGEEHGRRSRIHNPYGDGRASERITGAVKQYLAGSLGF